MLRDLAAVIFDLDDTLHDDTYAYQTAALEVAQEIAGAEAIDPVVLCSAYVEHAQRLWQTLSAEHLTTEFSETRHRLWATALAAVGIRSEEHVRAASRRYGELRRK